MRGAIEARNEPRFELHAWDILKALAGGWARIKPDLRERSLPDGEPAWRGDLVVLLVDGLTDVISGEGGEDQGLDGTGEQPQEHGRQGHH